MSKKKNTGREKGRELTNTFRYDLGDRLKTWRLARKLSLTEVAKRAGMSYHQYQQYESGQRVPSAIILFMLADALECKAEDLRPEGM